VELDLTAFATHSLYTLSLHDALPISQRGRDWLGSGSHDRASPTGNTSSAGGTPRALPSTSSSGTGTALRRPFSRLVSTWRLIGRSEEHTSELQSRENLVCRLLLEKKK